MSWLCCILDCSNRLEHNRGVSSSLTALWQAIESMDRQDLQKNLPLNTSTCVCSRNFIEPEGQKLCPDKYLTLNLLILPTQVTQAQKWKLPKKKVVSLPKQQ